MVACSNTKTSNNTDNSSSVVKKETKKGYTETQKKVIEKGRFHFFTSGQEMEYAEL